MLRFSTRWVVVGVVAIVLLLTFTALAGESVAQGLPVQFSGTIEAVNATTMIVNGQVVDITNVELTMPLQVGATVAVTGTRTADGRIVATTLALLTSGGAPTATPSPQPVITATPSRVFTCALPVRVWSDVEAWPVSTLMLGTQSYTENELRTLLNADSGGDASIILAQQLVAAKLNVSNGADAQPAGNAIIQADTMLSRFDGKIPYNLHPSSAVGQAMMTHAQLLNSYNSNLLTPNCVQSGIDDRDDDEDDRDDGAPVNVDDDQVVIIEGPVQRVTGNIITIYSIDVILDPDDPVLDRLEVGDIVRVEGFLDINERDDDGEIFVLIAINAVLVNIADYDRDRDGDVDDDFDDNSCDNPPPQWAPAHGWRARCEGAPHPGNREGSGRGNRRGRGGDQASGSRGRGGGEGS